jgi:hydrogenase expression/formation protein HypC
MCLGVPGKIIEVYEKNDLKMGRIDFGGAFREVCLAYTPEAQVGQYVVVHVGFALNVLDEEDAQETLALLREIGGLEDEIGPAAQSAA